METSNPNLVKDGEVEFDKRMTPETKAFVVEFQKSLIASNVSSISIELLTKGRDKEEKELIESLKLDNLEKPKEILIKNPVDGYEIPASIFVPTDVKKDAPITVFYHGGGWVACSIQSHYYPVASLASKTKTIWVSVEYRLAPEFKYKTQLTDYKAALEWVINNREQLSSKDAKIGVCGDSAGGHISALMGHYYKSILSYQILIYPAVDLSSHYKSFDEFKSNCYLITPDMVKKCIDDYLDEPEMAKSPDVSPIFMKDFSNLPKTLIVSAELDCIIDLGKAYHQKILEAKGDSEFKLIKGTIHGVFTFPQIIKNGYDESISLISEFLSKF